MKDDESPSESLSICVLSTSRTFLESPEFFRIADFGSILSDRSDGDSYLLASQSEEVGHGPKGILVAVINQSEHYIHSLVFSEKISPRNILWF